MEVVRSGDLRSAFRSLYFFYTFRAVNRQLRDDRVLLEAFCTRICAAQRRQCDAITVGRADGTNEKNNTFKPQEQYDKYAIKRLRCIPLICLLAPCAVFNNMNRRATTTVRNDADYGSPLREPGNWFRHHKRVCGLFVTSTRARAR